MTSLFSVVVANYKNAKYFQNLYSSVSNQTYQAWELIVVDDCSPGDDFEQISKVIKGDTRVKLFRHDKNQGVSATFRTAIENSTGEYIGLLGAEDALETCALSAVVGVLSKNPRVSLVNTNSYACDSDMIPGDRYDGFREPSGGSLIKDTTLGNFAAFPRWAYRLTDGFNAYYRRAADHDIFLKLDEVGERVYIEQCLYFYRLTGEGLSQGKNGALAAEYAAIAKLAAWRRRLLSGTNDNLSLAQALQTYSECCRKRAFRFRSYRRLASIGWLFLAVLTWPPILARRDPYSIFRRNFWPSE